jgi:hypothetical protein
MKSSDFTSGTGAERAPEKQREVAPLWKRCVAAAARIRKMVESASRRDLAVLRRLGRPGYPIPGDVVWEFLDRYAREEEHEMWAVVLPLMARRVFHVRGSLGYMMYEAGISPARLERWLRRDRASALREARLLITRMESTGIPWGEAGELLYEWNDEQRKRVARDFFRARRKASRRQTSTPTP